MNLPGVGKLKLTDERTVNEREIKMIVNVFSDKSRCRGRKGLVR